MCIIVEAHSDGCLFWIEDIAWVKKISWRSLLDQIESAITMKSFILLCSYNFNCKRAKFNLTQIISSIIIPFTITWKKRFSYCLLPGQQRASVCSIYCKICNNCYRVYSSIVMLMIRPVGIAALSKRTLKFLYQGYRIFKTCFEFCFDTFSLYK